MKIIEALKRIKHLDRKIEKNLRRINEWGSFVSNALDPEEPLYGVEDLRKMHQQIVDWTAEKARLRHLLHKTNLQTTATFEDRERTIDELLVIQAITLPGQLAATKAFKRKTKGHYEKAETRVVMQYDPKAKQTTIDDLEDRMANLNDLLDKVTLEQELVKG
jgi:hypothetical protein